MLRSKPGGRKYLLARGQHIHSFTQNFCHMTAGSKKNLNINGAFFLFSAVTNRLMGKGIPHRVIFLYDNPPYTKDSGHSISIDYADTVPSI